MTDPIMDEVQRCEREEYARATERHGQSFHSQHEGYAVLMEGTESIKDEAGYIEQAMETLWKATVHGNTCKMREVADGIRYEALILEAEAIKVAALARKIAENSNTPS